MTKHEIEAVFERVQTWPEELREDAAHMLLMMEREGSELYELSEEERDRARRGRSERGRLSSRSGCCLRPRPVSGAGHAEPSCASRCAEIMSYYRRSAGDGVVGQFMQDLTKRSELIAGSPYLGRATTQPATRVIMLKRFPHRLFYKALPLGELRIVRVRHASRRPVIQ